MLVEVLVCKLDGSRVIELQELPDDWLPTEEENGGSEEASDSGEE